MIKKMETKYNIILFFQFLSPIDFGIFESQNFNNTKDYNINLQNIFRQSCRAALMQNNEFDQQIDKAFDEYSRRLHFRNEPLILKILQLRDWSTINYLHLNNCQINNNTIKIIITMKWPFLKLLDLGNIDRGIKANQISAEGAKAVAERDWPSLSSIILTRNNIQNDGAYHILFTMKSLNQPMVSQNWITSVGIEGLLVCKYTENLVSLDLSGNAIGTSGANLLAKIRFAQLTLLDINDCSLGNSGLKALAKSYWPSLQNIFVQYNHVFLDGCTAISTVDWPSLKFFQINLFDYVSEMCYFGSSWRYPTGIFVIWSTRTDCVELEQYLYALMEQKLYDQSNRNI